MASTAAQNKARAANLRPFKPGQSGNPGGRPKGLAADIRASIPPEDFRRHFEAIWKRDVKALKELEIPLAEVTLARRNEAAEWLADRGYGKAPAFAVIEGGDPLDLDDVDSAIGAALDELAPRRETQAAGDGAEPDLAEGGQARAATA